jgi:hypothetical protein
VLRVEALERRDVPNNYTVNTLNDTHEANPLIGPGLDSDHHISLRSAIEDANRVGGQSAITFGGNAAQGLVSLTLNRELDLTANISINGAGQIAVAPAGGVGAPLSRIFHVESASNDLLIALELFNGDQVSGGAIRVEQGGTLTTEGLDIHDNHATGAGGAVANNGFLSISGGRIWNNESDHDAGGISNSGTLILQSVFID